MGISNKKLTAEEKLLHFIEVPGGLLSQESVTAEQKTDPSLEDTTQKGRKTGRPLIKSTLLKVFLLVFLLMLMTLAGFFLLQQRYLDTKLNGIQTLIGITGTDSARPAPDTLRTPPGLNLVGIFWSDRPQAVVEDTGSNKSYMIYEGENIGKYKVEKITDRHVYLRSNDGEAILR
ncbi:MAG: hypothetical protein PHH49_04660 [Candidatus Omnitrophica bacterium]|nr:hypothetical protein [Candidatus Omnitrophota bacterium]MDD5488239.1 hypothetical protein [Candidatus Omnitrophota bacterium]